MAAIVNSSSHYFVIRFVSDWLGDRLGDWFFLNQSQGEVNKTKAILNKGGKFLEQLWCCVGGRV